jgi:hypothetical protein
MRQTGKLSSQDIFSFQFIMLGNFGELQTKMTEQTERETFHHRK